tara:strand:- start:96 stop:575 length:480 start_codon:yes stop_codon:yes gene_type:complete
VSKERILKLKDSNGTIAYYWDYWNYFPNEKAMKKYKDELSGHSYKEIYIGVKKTKRSLPYDIDNLFDVFTETRPNLSFSTNETLVAYGKDKTGTFIFDNGFKEPSDIIWQRVREAEENKLTNKYKPLGTAVKGTSLLFKIIGTIIAYIFASNAIYWWLD